jgi:hypothetical protein
VYNKFAKVLYILTKASDETNRFSVYPKGLKLIPNPKNKYENIENLTNAFLILLCGKQHPLYDIAKKILYHSAYPRELEVVVDFFLKGLNRIQAEIERILIEDKELANDLHNLEEWLENSDFPQVKSEAQERIWKVFFPEAVGILQHSEKMELNLRKKRTIKVTQLNTKPISDPAREVLFTSNVLFTIPMEDKNWNDLWVKNKIKKYLLAHREAPQLYWYDHPIPIGVGLEENEVLYGLQGLEEAMDFERQRGNVNNHQKLTVLLSISVTHSHLHKIAKDYLEEIINQNGPIKNLDIYILTEKDCQKICQKILIPIAKEFLGKAIDEKYFNFFGVDGEYGRHYSFLKAISAFWAIFIDQNKKATFKTDLDQVFPQEQLITNSNGSAFDHFKTPLWGAHGIDFWQKRVELGMIAGALVNKKDIHKSLYAPDVTYPKREPSADEYIFFSTLPQALSTAAEISTTYDTKKLDGKEKCIQRIHVTGGTNGILISSLERYRPFTPSFFARAEDQAYLLSTMEHNGIRLGYVHQNGLIMRHDKETFIQRSIQASYIGKLIGDYIRILYFSTYARIINKDYFKIKERIDPFSGCFISKIPITVVHLRFALKALSMIKMGKVKPAYNFLTTGAARISDAIDFTTPEESQLKQQFFLEKKGWNLYYDILVAIKKALSKEEDYLAMEFVQKANEIIKQCKIQTGKFK